MALLGESQASPSLEVTRQIVESLGPKKNKIKISFDRIDILWDPTMYQIGVECM